LDYRRFGRTGLRVSRLGLGCGWFGGVGSDPSLFGRGEDERALDDLVHQGKVRYAGASNVEAWRLTRALWVSDRLGLARFDGVQNEYSLLRRDIEGEVLPMAGDQGLAVTPFSPLAGGLLTGRYSAGAGPPPGSARSRRCAPTRPSGASRCPRWRSRGSTTIRR
jgi:aryl-alcohol dehydrogenase-like predicted oxidoreductase